MFFLPVTAFIHEIDTARRWDAQQLHGEAARRARVLAHHITPERKNVVITHGNSLDFFADLFAVWLAKGTAVCANPGLTQSELENIVAFTDAALVLAPSGNGLAAVKDVPVICGSSAPDPEADQVSQPAQSASLDDPALMLFTSGTTGDPKGVVHSHRNLLARVALNAAHIGAPALERSLCVLPTHFGHGLIGNCLTPLATGGGLFLAPGAGMATAAGLGQILQTHAITFMSSVPSFWKMALRLSKPPAKAKIRRINIGSAPLSAELWRDVQEWAAGAEVANMYGITETANWIGGASSAEFEPQDGLLGRLWGGAAAVRQKDGRIADRGSGEILLRVPSVMSRYHRRPDLTDDVLRDGWYATGDLGSISPDGVLRLTGRERYVIIQGGINIFPEELDLLFERHQAVSEACAFGLDDPIAGQVVGLAVALHDKADTTSDALLAWARERLRPEAVPRSIHILPEIPKTDRGKLNRDIVARVCKNESQDQ